MMRVFTKEENWLLPFSNIAQVVLRISNGIKNDERTE